MPGFAQGVANFKKINDVHGHLVGDSVTRDLAGVLRASFREEDVAARYGPARSSAGACFIWISGVFRYLPTA